MTGAQLETEQIAKEEGRSPTNWDAFNILFSGALVISETSIDQLGPEQIWDEERHRFKSYETKY